MLPPARGDEVPESAFCCRGALVWGFHIFHVCFSADKWLVVAVDACVVWAKHSGLDVRLCENQCVRLQFLRVLYWPSHFLGQLRNCYFCIKSLLGINHFLCQPRNCYFSVKSLLGIDHFLGQFRNCYFSTKSLLGIDHFLGQLRNCYSFIKILVKNQPFPRPAPELLFLC